MHSIILILSPSKHQYCKPRVFPLSDAFYSTHLVSFQTLALHATRDFFKRCLLLISSCPLSNISTASHAWPFQAMPFIRLILFPLKHQHYKPRMISLSDAFYSTHFVSFQTSALQATRDPFKQSLLFDSSFLLSYFNTASHAWSL